MKVIIDDKIPYIRTAIEQIAEEVEYYPGSAFTPEIVRDADALIIRTRTRCDKALLEGSNVKFIATATIGFDHIDTAYLAENQIDWCNCPGCNASSVGQYLRSALILLKRDKKLNLSQLTLGIVGVGHVGSEVLKVAQEFGMQVLLNDPPLLLTDTQRSYVSLDEIAERCDIVTFHTPLTRTGACPTFHLADDAFFGKVARVPYIINTSRGEVVDNAALLRAMNEGRVADAIIDTWEHEPQISLPLLSKVFLGTPHIAGYSADGKANATRMALTALCRYFNKKVEFSIEPPALSTEITLSDDLEEQNLQYYNPKRDSDWLKQAPEKFEEYRGNYPLRRENVHNK